MRSRFIRHRSFPFRPHQSVRLLTDGGPYFTALLEAIAEARHYIFVESYIVRADQTGWKIAKALAEQAKAGVFVALSFDGYGSLGLAFAFTQFLESAGVHLLRFRPVSLLRGHAPWSQRNHRKLCVVDGAIGLVTGMNISDDYAPGAEGGLDWRDTGLWVRGTAVAQLEQIFRALWTHHSDIALPPSEHCHFAEDPGHEVRFVENHGYRGRRALRHTYLVAVARARDRIRISNAYFVPDPSLTRALIRAAERGVSVEVMVGAKTDVPSIHWVTRSLYTRLLKAGIRIYEWHERVLHAKTAVIDDHWSTVGSSNLDPISLFRNLELNAVVRSPDFAAIVHRQFERDVARCREVSLETWQQRGLWERVRDWFFGQFRRFY